jgi:probable addiction module antidote protein
MTKEKFTPWSVFDDLKTDTDIAAFLEACIEDNDYEFFGRALGIAANARGINATAKKLGVPRDSLYKSFSGNHKANYAMMFSAIKELGFGIRIVPESPKSKKLELRPQV